MQEVNLLFHLKLPCLKYYMLYCILFPEFSTVYLIFPEIVYFIFLKFVGVLMPICNFTAMNK